jgi:hypothetical protein
MYIQEVGWEGMKWIYLTQGRDKVAGYCECGNEPSGYISEENFLTSRISANFSARTVPYTVSKLVNFFTQEILLVCFRVQ